VPGRITPSSFPTSSVSQYNVFGATLGIYLSAIFILNFVI
jgi:hypothetical protein